jgi:AraC-like DNA-binding protein
MYRLLTGEESARFREIASSGSQSHRTAQAANWIRINYARPLRIQELAASVKLGVSTLHHQFRAMTSMSPLQYQKQRRLQEARRLMLTENYDEEMQRWRLATRAQPSSVENTACSSVSRRLET